MPESDEGETEKWCRMCRAPLRGERRAIALHHNLCVGTNSAYSVILSNPKNYDRPGRNRTSRHHRYRPSSERPRRSKSLPPLKAPPPHNPPRRPRAPEAPRDSRPRGKASPSRPEGGCARRHLAPSSSSSARRHLGSSSARRHLGSSARRHVGSSSSHARRHVGSSSSSSYSARRHVGSSSSSSSARRHVGSSSSSARRLLVSSARRHLASAARRHLASSVAETTTPPPPQPSAKRARGRRKEVHYSCGPCGKELNSWYTIRKHLLSSEHLQTVSKHRRRQIGMLKWRSSTTTIANGALCDPQPTAASGGGSGGMSCEVRALWDIPEGVPVATPKEQLMAGLHLVKVAGGDISLNPFGGRGGGGSCSVPVKPLAVPEATGSIEGASGNLWPPVKGGELQHVVSSCSSSVNDLSAPGTGSGCHTGIPQVGGPGGRNGDLVSVPGKRLVLCHSARWHATTTTSHVPEGQRPTFVRIDYDKKGQVPSRNSGGTRGQYEWACIKDGVYRSTRVRRKGDLPRPLFVDMGVRCDSEQFRLPEGIVRAPSASAGGGAVQLSIVERLLQGSSEYSGESLFCSGRPLQYESEDGDSKESVSTMIRFDYTSKTSVYTNEEGPSGVRCLTYMSQRGVAEGVRSISSLSIQSLVDEEALGERLYLSDSEDLKEVVDPVCPLPSSEGHDRVVELDSQRFLSRLVNQLNDGGLCCHFCGSTMDVNSLLSQLYNGSSGKLSSADPNPH